MRLLETFWCITFASRVSQAVQVDDRHDPARLVRGSNGLNSTRTSVDGPIIVSLKRSVHKARVCTDHATPLIDESRESEVLLVTTPLRVVYGPGVAGDEHSPMFRQQHLHVIEEVRSLWKSALAVLEAGPTARTRRSRGLLKAHDLGRRVEKPGSKVVE